MPTLQIRGGRQGEVAYFVDGFSQQDPLTNLSTTAINNNGEVAGVGRTADDEDHAFYWKDWSITDIGTLGGQESQAGGINGPGVVVGQSDIDPSASRLGEDGHGFLWKDGILVDLNDRLWGNTDWIVEDAADINDNGLIIGVGRCGGASRAILLVPES